MKKLIVVLLLSITSMFAFENLTADNFDAKVKDKNVIVDFYATWWFACKTLGKSLTKYNTSKQEDVTIYKVDIDQEPELTQRFKIRGIPVLVYIKKGEVKATQAGVKTAEQIKENVKKYLQ